MVKEDDGVTHLRCEVHSCILFQRAITNIYKHGRYSYRSNVFI